MSVAIGEFLTCLRNEAGASQKEICKGICKVSAYSNYERDERVPDFLTLNLILERLGHGIMGLSAYVTEEEAEYLQWRMSVTEALREQKYDKLDILSKQEPDCISLSENIRRQYALYIKGVVAEVQGKNFSSALEHYEEALRLTCPFLLDEGEFTARIGKSELGIYTVYLWLLARLYPERARECREKLERLMEYALIWYCEEEERVKSYPHLACIWARLSLEHVDSKKIHQTMLEVYHLLKKQGKMYHVTEVLRLIIASKTEEERCKDGEQKDYQAICRLYQLFGKSTEFNPYEIGENIWMLTLVGDYLAEGRRRRGFSQEEISEGICAPESYSRIENSKRLPSRRNYKALTEKLSIEPRYFTEIINTGNYRAIMLRRKISEAFFHREFSKGRELLKELEEELGADREKNNQYFEERYAACAYGLGEVSPDEHFEKIKQILSYTLPLEDIGKGKHIYIRNEINLINQLGGIYEKKEEYEKGIVLFQNFLEDMKHHKLSEEQRFRETYLIALNLNRLLTDIGRFVEGNEICMKWAKMAVNRGHADLLDNYLVEISYNLENLQKDTSDYPETICRLALDISDVYGTKKSNDFIKNYFVQCYRN